MTTIGNESRPAYVYDAETDTWVPIGVGPHTHDEYIDKTIITAKGDIIVGTALDAVAKLGVGTTGQVLVVNPSTATGLEWANRQETITGAATTITTTDLTANQALVSDGSGKVDISSVTATELGYVSGVTSGIQGQLNGKSPTAGSTSITTLGTVTAGTWNASTIAVGRGGTGATTLTSGGYLKGAGASAITSQSGIPAGDVTSGTFDKARMPVGSVLQVVSSVYAVQNTTTSTGYVSAGISATITPRSASSKILILMTAVLEMSGNPQSSKSTIFRSGTDLTNSTLTFYQQSGGPLWHTVAINYLDSPSTTAARTYELRFRVNSGSGSISMQVSSTPTNMTLIEVQG